MAKPQKHSKSHGSSKRPGKHGLKPKIKSSKKVKKSESEAAPKLPPPPPPPPPPELLLTASQQLEFFIQQYQSANSIQLSSLELESFTEKYLRPTLEQFYYSFVERFIKLLTSREICEYECKGMEQLTPDVRVKFIVQHHIPFSFGIFFSTPSMLGRHLGWDLGKLVAVEELP